MLVRIVPGSEPVEVVKVEETTRDGQPCWVIFTAPERVPLQGGGMQAHSRYVVPKSYTGLQRVG